MLNQQVNILQSWRADERRPIAAGEKGRDAMSDKMIAELGEIMQIAFVPQDFDATIAHWVKMGAGSFYVICNNQAEWQEAYRVECRPELDIALGQWDEMQIEVIRQNSVEKTIKVYSS